MAADVECAAGQAARQVVQTKAVLTRQRYVTLVALALAAWTARNFLLPLACASMLETAIWPLYRRAIKRTRRRQGRIAARFPLATACLVILPISIAAVAVVQESYAGDGIGSAGSADWRRGPSQF